MNQIETLKYIALNGNPIGTEAESDYNNYKSDPTFRKLAIQAASGRNLIGSPLEAEYNNYKDTVNTNTSTSNSLPTNQDPLFKNDDNNGQMVLESAIPDKVNSVFVQPTKDYLHRLPNELRQATAYVPGIIGAGIGAIQPDNTAKEGFDSAYKQGVNNEGIAGAIADPINYLGLGIPGGALESGIGRLLGEGNIAKYATKPISGLVAGLGLSAADQKLNNGNVKALPTIIGGGLGLAGGLVSGIGKMISNKVDNYASPDLDNAIVTSIKSRTTNDPKNIYSTYQEATTSPNGEFQKMPDDYREHIINKAKEAIAEDPTTLYKSADEVPLSEANQYFKKMVDLGKANVANFNKTIKNPIDISELGNYAKGGLYGAALGNMVAGTPLIGAALGLVSKSPTVLNEINKVANSSIPVVKKITNNPVSSNLFNGLYDIGKYNIPTLPSKVDSTMW